jgi:hypothetical protein
MFYQVALIPTSSVPLPRTGEAVPTFYIRSWRLAAVALSVLPGETARIQPQGRYDGETFLDIGGPIGTLTAPGVIRGNVMIPAGMTHLRAAVDGTGSRMVLVTGTAFVFDPTTPEDLAMLAPEVSEAESLARYAAFAEEQVLELLAGPTGDAQTELARVLARDGALSAVRRAIVAQIQLSHRRDLLARQTGDEVAQAALRTMPAIAPEVEAMVRRWRRTDTAHYLGRA